MSAFIAPTLDPLIEVAKSNVQVSGKLKPMAKAIFDTLCQLAVQGDDEYRKIWLVADRGSIEDFGSFKESKEEAVVKTKREFQEYWLSEYPEEQKWYSISVNTYQGVFYLYINSRLAVSTDGEGDSYPNLIKHQQKLLTLLSKEVNKVVKEIMKNADGYNERIARDLAYQHRLGKIKRSVYWSIFADEKKRFKKVLTQKDFETLAKIVEQSKEENTLTPIKFMTSGYFFKCCALGYDANQYFKGKEGFSAKEKYARMADGRDCALKELKQNSIDEFTKWYSHERNCGGHPWEICRGGNSTHISLFISQVNGGWMLRLAGSSAGRVVETVKIAIALYEKNIPFILDRATEIYNMVRGEDFIGIVPEGITPRYCHSLFPNTDRIIDFMNLDFEKRDAVVKKADWFPEEEVKSLKKKK